MIDGEFFTYKYCATAEEAQALIDAGAAGAPEEGDAQRCVGLYVAESSPEGGLKEATLADIPEGAALQAVDCAHWDRGGFLKVKLRLLVKDGVAWAPIGYADM
jgi:hypothetical protein